MNISRKWLEAFLRRPLETHELTERLAMLGAPVDAVEQSHAELADLVIGLVEEVQAHPDADRLSVCTVFDGGDERHQVVCGAPNVEAGKLYPFAGSAPSCLVASPSKNERFGGRCPTGCCARPRN